MDFSSPPPTPPTLSIRLVPDKLPHIPAAPGLLLEEIYRAIYLTGSEWHRFWMSGARANCRAMCSRENRVWDKSTDWGREEGGWEGERQIEREGNVVKVKRKAREEKVTWEDYDWGRSMLSMDKLTSTGALLAQKYHWDPIGSWDYERRDLSFKGYMDNFNPKVRVHQCSQASGLRWIRHRSHH